MPQFQEKPRGSAGNNLVSNPSEMHCACVLLIDTSASMRDYRQRLIDALVEFRSTLESDSDARARVDIEVVTFDSHVHKLTGFGSVSQFTVPDIVCEGTTCTHDAVHFALEEIKARKQEYIAGGTPYYRPWLFLLTDGNSNDIDTTNYPNAFQELVQAQLDRHVVFYGVAIGDQADRKEVASMHCNGVVITPTMSQFREVFQWLSASVIQTSSQPTAITVAINPAEKNLAWNQISVNP